MSAAAMSLREDVAYTFQLSSIDRSITVYISLFLGSPLSVRTHEPGGCSGGSMLLASKYAFHHVSSLLLIEVLSVDCSTCRNFVSLVVN